jgi:hypothetical protein
MRPPRLRSSFAGDNRPGVTTLFSVPSSSRAAASMRPHREMASLPVPTLPPAASRGAPMHIAPGWPRARNSQRTVGRRRLATPWIKARGDLRQRSHDPGCSFVLPRLQVGVNLNTGPNPDGSAPSQTTFQGLLPLSNDLHGTFARVLRNQACQRPRHRRVRALSLRQALCLVRPSAVRVSISPGFLPRREGVAPIA